MKNKKIVIGNWKMYLDFKKSVKLYEKIISLPTLKNIETVICPSLSVLGFISSYRLANIKLGSQIVSPYEVGAYTGQVNIDNLKQIGCKYVLLGHSETRQYLNSDDKQINQQLKLVLDTNIVPVICIGETCQEYKAGLTNKIIRKQLKTIFNKIGKNNRKSIIIAYEPIWAIGTGKVILVKEAEKIHEIIKKYLAKIGFEKNIKVIYGGSVKPDNAKDLLNSYLIDGCLVGGSSVKFNEFYSIMKIADAVNLKK